MFLQFCLPIYLLVCLCILPQSTGKSDVEIQSILRRFLLNVKNTYRFAISTDSIKALRKELFQNRGYDPMARPVRNYTHTMNVSIYLDINYIKKLVSLSAHCSCSQGFTTSFERERMCRHMFWKAKAGSVSIGKIFSRSSLIDAN